MVENNHFFQEETKKEWTAEEEEEVSAFRDNRIQTKRTTRRPRQFQFAEQGKYIREVSESIILS